MKNNFAQAALVPAGNYIFPYWEDLARDLMAGCPERFLTRLNQPIRVNHHSTIFILSDICGFTSFCARNSDSTEIEISRFLEGFFRMLEDAKKDVWAEGSEERDARNNHCDGMPLPRTIKCTGDGLLIQAPNNIKRAFQYTRALLDHYAEYLSRSGIAAETDVAVGMIRTEKYHEGCVGSDDYRDYTVFSPGLNHLFKAMAHRPTEHGRSRSHYRTLTIPGDLWKDLPPDWTRGYEIRGRLECGGISWLRVARMKEERLST